MEYLILFLVLLSCFFFMLFIPTILLLKEKGRKKKKNKNENLIIYGASTLVFLILIYMFSSYYHLNAVSKPYVECSVLANINCMFSNNLAKEIRPSFTIYLVFFTQLLVMFAFSYYTAQNITKYRSVSRRTVNLILFFLVGISSSITHYFVLYDVAFVSGLKYVTIICANAYATLPFMFLLFLSYLNKDVLFIK